MSFERPDLAESFPQEYTSYLSIDTPYLDEGSSESSQRGEHVFCPALSTENLTPRQCAALRVSRQISRSRSMDRYRSERRSRRSSLTGSGKRTRRASGGSNLPQRCASLRPLDLYLEYPGSSSPRRGSPRLPSSRRNSVSPRRPPVVTLRSAKERRRRRNVVIICSSFLALLLASVLVVVVTLTHSSVISVHNVTSKYYTFSVPPHHPLMRQENERMMHESFNIGLPNSSQSTMAEHKSVPEHPRAQ